MGVVGRFPAFGAAELDVVGVDVEGSHQRRVHTPCTGGEFQVVVEPVELVEERVHAHHRPGGIARERFHIACREHFGEVYKHACGYLCLLCHAQGVERAPAVVAHGYNLIVEQCQPSAERGDGAEGVGCIEQPAQCQAVCRRCRIARSMAAYVVDEHRHQRVGGLHGSHLTGIGGERAFALLHGVTGGCGVGG